MNILKLRNVLHTIHKRRRWRNNTNGMLDAAVDLLREMLGDDSPVGAVICQGEATVDRYYRT